MKKKQQALFQSAIALLLCVSMLIGTTFAWFTDQVSSLNNIITAGNLDVELEYLDDNGNWKTVNNSSEIFDPNTLWEPGHTEVAYLRVSNLGTLALKYQLGVNIASETGSTNVNGKEFKLSDYIYFGSVEGVQTAFPSRQAARAAVNSRTLISKGYTKPGAIEAGAPAHYVAIVVYMPEEVGNEANYAKGYAAPKIELGINVIATQYTSENDSFGKDYDDNAKFPEVDLTTGITVPVTPDANGKVPSELTIASTSAPVFATVPAGVQLEAGTASMTLSVSEMTKGNVDIPLGVNEIKRSLDVHISGVAASNTVPMLITVPKAMMTGLNMGNYKLYHVENGTPVQMTYVASAAELDAHNEFTYDPVTGDVTMALASFSEVAVVADTENPWEGNFDDSWYVGKSSPYTIANADQLAALSAIVGGMDGQTQDSFKGKTIKLVSDINLGDKESENNPNIIFYPIGYYNSEGTYERTNTAITSGLKNFEGTFDGNGHTIANFYQNTWEMKGDNNYYDATLQYYRDGMGLFGKIYKGKVKNLTVSNFSSDGEYTTTGVIAAYADGATFENIAIFNCNPRVYNIGNGGIVGCVGWYAKDAGLNTTFKNITVDNSNKISALWGSYDVACGGIVGQYYPTSGQSGTPANAGIDFKNCHVSAQMDVYNDVCANYQYYAYRYTGMLIGSVRENETINGHVYPKMDGITASGCTVHFGTWNDYYYCEIIDNTTASYTHDYQMSRLTEIKAIDGTTITYLDGTTGTVPASGRANYVIVDYNKGHGTENATCHHFKDGAVWTHDMGGIQTGIDENGDGQDDLKEDKQHIYLEFNNLVTGYGWGVTSKGVGDLAGVTILDREVADSVNKFTPVIDNNTKFSTENIVSIGDLFAAIENAGVDIKSDNVQVTVSPFGADSTAGGTYNANTTDWTQGTLTFSGVGQAVITITDYYFCKTATVTVNIVSADKFDTKFTGDFLYRVGNVDKSTVALGTIFKVINNATVDSASVNVDFETVAGNANGTFTSNDTWTNGKIQFSGTGVVKVKIKDDTSTEFTLNLEVVDATNVAEGGKISNYGVSSVLLGNTTVSTLYLNGGATLYGNGFTIDCTNSPINGTGNVSENYIIGLAGANLDNVKIVGKVYTKYGAMATDDYNRALIISTGNSTITNCYLSNTAAPIRINSGSLTVKGTTVKGGNFANIDVRSGHLTLDNVTTINQALGNDKAEDGSTVIGLGIVVYYEMVNAPATSITVKNGLKQYNHISSNDKFSNTYANQFVTKMFENSNNTLQYTNGSTKWVNSGIILMTSGINVTGAGDKSDVSFMGETGAVYTTRPTAASVIENPAEYATLGQGVIAPSALLDHDNKEKGNYIPKEAGKNDYCYFDGEKILISMDEGDIFQYDPFILNATKLGNSLNYTVKLNGSAVDNGSKISFNAVGEYTITYTYEDPYNYRFNNSGELETFTVTYSKTDVVSVAIVEPEDAHAEFTFVKDDNSTVTVTEEILYNNNTYISAKDVTEFGTSWGKITVGDKTIVYPIVEANVNKTASNQCQVFYYVFNDVISITDANGKVYSHKEGTGTDGKMPSNLKVVKGNELKVDNKVFENYNDTNLTRTGGKIFCYSSSSQEDSPVKFNDSLAFKSPSGLKFNSSTRNYDAAVIVQYQFTDSNNATYYYYVGYKITNPNTKCPSGDGEDTTCVTPDTLITLADGTQVRVDSLTGNEELLVWNMETGKLDKAPIMFVDSDPESEYEIIHLYFSDGTDVKVIYEHGFWDYDLNKYVYLDANASDYIGHTFAKQNGDSLEKVQLVDVVIENEVTTAWSPVTEGHLCYFVNGMLSMPGGVGGLFNIFDVDAETMTYDFEAMQKDIETYGLYTYEELNAIAPLSEEMFNAAGGAYLKVSIGKGNLTEEELIRMINRYSKFFN